MSITRRALLAHGLALGGAAVVTGCSTTTRVSSSGGSEPDPVSGAPLVSAAAGLRTIGVVGDSITLASKAALQLVLAPAGYGTIVFDAETGRRIDVGNGKGGVPLSGVRTLAKLLAAGAKPDVWLLALGTNDLGSYPDAAAFGGLIDELLVLPPKRTPVVWVDVYLPDRPQPTEEFNTALHQRIQARGNATVASWNAAASAKGAKLLRGDHIHPNDAGTTAWAAVVAQALQRL